MVKAAGKNGRTRRSGAKGRAGRAGNAEAAAVSMSGVAVESMDTVAEAAVESAPEAAFEVEHEMEPVCEAGVSQDAAMTGIVPEGNVSGVDAADSGTVAEVPPASCERVPGELDSGASFFARIWNRTLWSRCSSG